jgi:hypothetical protein
VLIMDFMYSVNLIDVSTELMMSAHIDDHAGMRAGLSLGLALRCQAAVIVSLRRSQRVYAACAASSLCPRAVYAAIPAQLLPASEHMCLIGRCSHSRTVEVRSGLP